MLNINFYLSLQRFLEILDHSYKNISCLTCKSKQIGALADLDEYHTNYLDQNKTCNFYKKNQAVFTEGSLPRGVFCLNQGKVKVYALGGEGKEQIIHIAKTGDIIGFRAMFSGEPYKVSASTLEECNICFVSKEDFFFMIEEVPSFRNNILKELSRELSDQALFITSMAQKTVRERVAYALLMLDKIYKDEEINLSREDLANFVGTATETLIRLLSEFKDEKIIETHSRKIQIIDYKKLEKIAGITKFV